MKKRIFFTLVGCLTVLSLISCHPDYTHYTHYTYINQTASTITIECYYGGAWEAEEADPDELYKTITIPSGESETVSLSDMTFCLPFRWLHTYSLYLLINNGSMIIFDDHLRSGTLLEMETYTLTSSSETVRNYEYVFTEEYFKDGKPIE